jgi:flagellar protein FliS
LTGAVKAYWDTLNETLPKEKAVVELFRRLVCTLEQAGAAIERRDVPVAHRNLVAAQEVVAGLAASLDPRAGELADNLAQLYAYIGDLLVQANLRKERAPVEEAVNLLQVLLSGWEGAAQKDTSRLKRSSA